MIFTEGRLWTEISDGTLSLKADRSYRNRFTFSIGEKHVGLYRVFSISPGVLELYRGIGKKRQLRDPFTGIIHIMPERILHTITPDNVLFLLELDSGIGGWSVIDKLAFKCETVNVRQAFIDCVDFEIVRLSGVIKVG